MDKISYNYPAMPDLEHTLQGHDLGFLKIVAGAWGIDLNAPDTVTALPIVVSGVLEHADFAEVIEALPSDARGVLQALLQNEGRMPWAAFVRKYGDVRRMGSAKRDRERPDRKPVTAAEVLWYRGLIGRAFLAMPPAAEPQEYAYIPEDLLPLLPSLRTETPDPLGRPATPNESAEIMLADDRILEHACTLLAALRLKLEPAALAALNLGGIPLDVLKGLLRAAHLLDEEDVPHPERTRAFLEAPRGKALAQLVQSWMEDRQFNELRLLPGLKFEGEWINDPLRARQAVLELVSQVPENRWWGLNAFVNAIHEQQPDFQRPAGDYDSWFIRKEASPSRDGAPSKEGAPTKDGAPAPAAAQATSETGAATSGGYLRGFGAWDEVDGALVRFLIQGPMHWLGLLDLAAPAAGEAPTAMRLSRWSEALWHGGAPAGLPNEDGVISASSDGRLRLPVRTPRAVRYQVARFCQWEGEKERDGRRLEYLYRLTPGSLERARAQGLRVAQFISLLRRHAENPLPPLLIQALERWESAGTQAIVERVVLLRVTNAEILAALRKTRAARCLGEALNETSVFIRPGMEEQVLSALAEAGYLAEARLLESGS